MQHLTLVDRFFTIKVLFYIRQIYHAINMKTHSMLTAGHVLDSLGGARVSKLISLK